MKKRLLLLALTVCSVILLLSAQSFAAADKTKSIASYQPYRSSYSLNANRVMSDHATDACAFYITDTLAGFDFDSATVTGKTNTANDDNFDDAEVSFEALKQLDRSDIIIWHGHGDYNSKYGSFLGTGIEYSKELAQKYAEDIEEKRLVVYSGRFCITGKFIDHYYEDGAFDGMLIYLGTCSSGKDMLDGNVQNSELVRAFINKGAKAVIANSGDICTVYNTSFMNDFFKALCTENVEGRLNTLDEAMTLCIEKDGPYCCEASRTRPYIFSKDGSGADCTLFDFGEHTHSLSFVDGKKPGCTENGWYGYYTCTAPGCGASFSDADGTKPIDPTEWINGDGKRASLGHSWDGGHISGDVIEYTCTRCKSTRTEPVPKTDIKTAVIELSQSEFKYDGKEKTPELTVTLNGKTLTEGKDYVVSYSDNIKSGTATVTVTGTGRFAGSVSENFTITYFGFKNPLGDGIKTLFSSFTDFFRRIFAIIFRR